MGARIQILNKKKYFGEDVADLFIQSSYLKGIRVPVKWITKSIDDLVIVWIACGLAKGISYFHGISELKFKESNRIKAGTKTLNNLGIKTHSTNNSIKIYGNPNIKPKEQIKISSNLDHRIAMANFIAASVTGSNILIRGFETVGSSFPNFLKLQKKIIGTKYEIKTN